MRETVGAQADQMAAMLEAPRQADERMNAVLCLDISFFLRLCCKILWGCRASYAFRLQLLEQ